MRSESWVDSHWRVVLVCIALVVQALSVSRALFRPGRPALNVDSAFFQHAGWYVTQGGALYRDIWDIKPPLAVETTTVFAALAGNPLEVHLLSVGVTAAAAVGCSLLVGLLATQLVDDGRAALLAGLVVVTMPGFYHLSANGFRPKYLVLCLGLAALLLAFRNHPLAAGVAAAGAAGYWQYGVVFPALVVGIVLNNRDRRALGYALAGMAGVACVAVAPIIMSGDALRMVTEVVYVPLVAQAAESLTQRLGKLVFYLVYALVPVAVGVYGLATAGRRGLRRHWWVYAGLAWGVLQVFFDLDSAPDLYLLVVFSALGVAFAVHRALPRSRRVFSFVMAGIVLLNAAWIGGVVANPVADQPATEHDGSNETLRAISTSVNVSQEHAPPRHGIPRVKTLFWQTRMPPSCHYRLSGTERNWLARTNQSSVASPCGNVTIPDRPSLPAGRERNS